MTLKGALRQIWTRHSGHGGWSHVCTTGTPRAAALVCPFTPKRADFCCVSVSARPENELIYPPPPKKNKKKIWILSLCPSTNTPDKVTHGLCSSVMELLQGVSLVSITERERKKKCVSCISSCGNAHVNKSARMYARWQRRLTVEGHNNKWNHSFNIKIVPILLSFKWVRWFSESFLTRFRSWFRSTVSSESVVLSPCVTFNVLSHGQTCCCSRQVISLWLPAVMEAVNPQKEAFQSSALQNHQAGAAAAAAVDESLWVCYGGVFVFRLVTR